MRFALTGFAHQPKRGRLMATSQKRSEEKSTPAGEAGGDLQRLKTHGSASVEELRDFISQMHGKSPQEVLGAVAESDLVRSTLIATAGFAVVLVALTIIPYAFSGNEQEAQAAASAESSNQETGSSGQNDPSLNQGTAYQVPVAPTGGPPTASGQPNAQKAVDALGIGESKAADAKSNPLDKKVDSLLDGLD